jgi:hypothetical protein
MVFLLIKIPQSVLPNFQAMPPQKTLTHHSVALRGKLELKSFISIPTYDETGKLYGCEETFEEI